MNSVDCHALKAALKMEKVMTNLNQANRSVFSSIFADSWTTERRKKRAALGHSALRDDASGAFRRSEAWEKFCFGKDQDDQMALFISACFASALWLRGPTSLGGTRGLVEGG